MFRVVELEILGFGGTVCEHTLGFHGNRHDGIDDRRGCDSSAVWKQASKSNAFTRPRDRRIQTGSSGN